MLIQRFTIRKAARVTSVCDYSAAAQPLVPEQRWRLILLLSLLLMWCYMRILYYHYNHYYEYDCT